MVIEEGLRREQIRDRVMLVVVLTVFLDLIGYGLTIPLLPLYAKSMNTSMKVVSLIVGFYAAAQLILTPVLGRLSDRYGRRPVMLLSLAGNAASMILFAVATHYSVLALLFVSRILAGATAGNLSACQASIADITTKEERVGAMGRLGAGIGLGMMLGPPIGGLLMKWFGPSGPPIGAGLMALIDLGLAAVLMPETWRPPASSGGPRRDVAAPRATFAQVISDPRIVALLCIYFLTFVSMSSMNLTLPVLVEQRFHWGSDRIGYLFGMFGAIGLVIQAFMVNRLARRFGEIALVAAAACFLVAGMLTLAFATTGTVLVLGICIISAAVAINNPSISSLASQYAAPGQQGATLGFAQSAGGAARAIAPFWIGSLIDRFSARAPLFCSIGAATLVLVVVMNLVNINAKRASQSSAAP